MFLKELIDKSDQKNIITGTEALENLDKNKFNDWAASHTDGREQNPNSAGLRWRAAREQNSCLFIDHKAKFRIDPDEFIFTIGSCFARNVEVYLIQQGMKLCTAGFSMPDNLYDPTHFGIHQHLKNPDRRPFVVRTPLNKYNLAAMQFELERCLLNLELENKGCYLNKDWENINLYDALTSEPIGENYPLWFDPHAHHTAAGIGSSWENTEAVRDYLDLTTRSIREASVVILTLGMTEAWIDTITGIVLNDPGKMLLDQYQDQLKFINMSHSQVKKMLREYC